MILNYLRDLCIGLELFGSTWLASWNKMSTISKCQYLSQWMWNRPVAAVLLVCFPCADLVIYFTLVNCRHSTIVTVIVDEFVTTLKRQHYFLCTAFSQPAIQSINQNTIIQSHEWQANHKQKAHQKRGLRHRSGNYQTYHHSDTLVSTAPFNINVCTD